VNPTYLIYKNILIMKKSKVSSSVDYIYIETLLNKQMRSNIRMLHNRIVNVPVT
jgi:hypothetical protein